MALPNFTDQKIQETYQRVLQTDGENIYNGTGSALPLKIDGPDLIVSGAVRAQSYIISESVTVVTSGSTVFGDSTDDIHRFTGSLKISEEVTTDLYKININPALALTSQAVRMVGNVITFGPGGFDVSESYDVTVSGSVLRLYAASDIITNIGGDDFRIEKSGTEYFRFNLDTDPKIDATGDIIINPSGGDMHLHGSDLTVTGSINASGDINGTIDGGTF
jgi:cytoskeletal protein CcmA (bactofilin family)